MSGSLRPGSHGLFIVLLSSHSRSRLFMSSANGFVRLLPGCACSLSLPLSQWAASEAIFLCAEVKQSSEKGCWQHILMRRHDGEHLCAMLSFFFWCSNTRWYSRDSQSSHSVLGHSTFSDMLVFLQPQVTLPLIFIFLLCSLLSLPLFLILSRSFSLSSAHWYKYTKCGRVTTKATTDFLFSALQPVARWHKTTLK